MSKEPTAKQLLALEQYRRAYQTVHANLRSIDTKAQNVASLASIIITISFSVRAASTQSDLNKWILAVLIGYIATMAFAIWAMWPRRIRNEPAIKISENLKDSTNVEDLYQEFLRKYPDVIKENRKKNTQKTIRLFVAYLLLVLTVIVSLAMSIT